MSRLALTFACGAFDRTEALPTGEVAVEGIDLNYLSIEAPREIFDRIVGGVAIRRDVYKNKPLDRQQPLQSLRRRQNYALAPMRFSGSQC